MLNIPVVLITCGKVPPVMRQDPVSSRRILVLIISTFLHFKHGQMGLIHHTTCTAQPFLGATVDYENQLSLITVLLVVVVLLIRIQEYIQIYLGE